MHWILFKGALKAMEKGNLKLSIPSLVTDDGEVISEVFLICYKLIETLPHLRAFFLGANQEEENEIKNIKINLKEGKEFRKVLFHNYYSTSKNISNQEHSSSPIICHSLICLCSQNSTTVWSRLPMTKRTSTTTCSDGTNTSKTCPKLLLSSQISKEF